MGGGGDGLNSLPNPFYIAVWREETSDDFMRGKGGQVRRVNASLSVLTMRVYTRVGYENWMPREVGIRETPPDG